MNPYMDFQGLFGEIQLLLTTELLDQDEIRIYIKEQEAIEIWKIRRILFSHVVLLNYNSKEAAVFKKSATENYRLV